MRNAYDMSLRISYAPGSPSHGAFRSTGRETLNIRTSEIEKRRLVLPPVVYTYASFHHGSIEYAPDRYPTSSRCSSH